MPGLHGKLAISARPAARWFSRGNAVNDIVERDWKTLRALKPQLLARLCDQILRGAARITRADTPPSHARYLKLYRFIQAQDDKVAAAFNDHRRSTAIERLATIYNLGLLTDSELSHFSQQTRTRFIGLADIFGPWKDDDIAENEES